MPAHRPPSARPPAPGCNRSPRHRSGKSSPFQLNRPSQHPNAQASKAGRPGIGRGGCLGADLAALVRQAGLSRNAGGKQARRPRHGIGPPCARTQEPPAVSSAHQRHRLPQLAQHAAGQPAAPSPPTWHGHGPHRRIQLRLTLIPAEFDPTHMCRFAAFSVVRCRPPFDRSSARCAH